ncbi:DUF1800 domain-containing protein [Bordetella genomosp. 13]|uniref:DUF1800 domain-containing protein n=1 Tax=Bordetella genomosp. 13 TaxID=463040 RepID=UPI0021B6D6F5|nr:DUF1800 domain-containing protein [Bordetella genomosp. 13]
MSARRLRNAFAATLLLAWTCACGAQSAPLWRQVDRVTWGVTPSELAAARKAGWQAYLDQQLKPDLRIPLPAEVQSRIDALSISQVPGQQAYRQQVLRARENRDLPDAQRKQANAETRKITSRRSGETIMRSTWRALYSRDQLQEVMTWFWMNHFSVYSSKGNIGTLLDDYEDRTIRPHTLGKFGDLLRATVRSPAMLVYLDNARNVAGRINENYARELMELHTLGVDGGYSQHDVQELARILTGMTINPLDKAPKVDPAQQAQVVSDGLFLFNPRLHDSGSKTVLGHDFENGGMREIDSALDMLARQPATARHISRKLAQYFVSEQPPDALVQRMAQTFLKTDGDIAATLRAMFDSPEFAASLERGKFKDPTQYVYSSMRLAYDSMPPIRSAQPVVAMVARQDQLLGRRVTPDGYPVKQSDWSSSGQMTTRFEIARTIATSRAPFYRDADGEPPQLPAMPLLLDAYGKTGDQPFAALSPATRGAIEKAPDRNDANALLLSSPEFMRR